MLLLTFGFSVVSFKFLLSVVKLQFSFSFLLLDTRGWSDRFLIFRLSAGTLVRQSSCLSPVVHKTPSAYHLSGTAP